jgi:Flp pilus assembly pilin Flp
MRALIEDERGGSAVEFALAITAVVLLTMGIVDFGRAAWQWNALHKAAQLGARAAVVRDPLHRPIKYHFECNPPAPEMLGRTCVDPGSGGVRAECALSASLVCTKDGCNGRGYDPGEAAVFDAILAAMRRAYPALDPDHVTVTYTATNLGFVGKPGGLVAEVGAEVGGLVFEFSALSPLSLAGLPMPVVRATLISEDLSDNSAVEQGVANTGGGGRDDPALNPR